ncbi:unnamed protein product [Oppiella nova]|uniref:Uncharacterized protein n=1 Tax=Oppiella nova TaxID=334625 RepID=A0A7R9QBV5_9ACAR|nr:unnamed protein product [Oppiella nova]CAG2161781.1 unnamed protein product [Oppiella nova]
MFSQLVTYCQYQNGLGSTLSTTTPSPGPPAQVHYVNIGADLAGDYKPRGKGKGRFGYDTGKGPKGQSFREETRSADGTVRGAYGYTDANGQQRIVKYSAGKEGFKIEDDSPAQGGGNAPAPTSAPYRPPQTLPPQIYRPQPSSAPQSYSRPQSSPQSYQSSPQSYQSPSGNGYLELNVRPVPQQYRPPTQTLRQVLSSPSQSGVSYSGGSLSSSVSSLPQYSGLSSSSLSSNSGSSGSSISYPQMQPQLQQYRPPSQARPQAPVASSQPILRSYSGLATTSRPEEETWGPPVINTALLSYNIGSQGGQPVSRLSYSSSSSSETYEAPPPPRPSPSRSTSYTGPVAPAYTDWNTPILRSYSNLSGGPAIPLKEEKWGPPVINTALLSYNIGSQQG